MAEEKRKGFFARAFNSIKEDVKNLTELDNDLKKLIDEVMYDDREIDDIDEILEIGEWNNIKEDKRIIDAFTALINDKFKEIFKNNVQDDVFTNSEIFYPLANLQSLTKFANEKKLKPELFEKLSLYSRNSSLIYDSLENLQREVASVNLQRGEYCYLDSQQVIWKEQKSKTKRVNYGGVGLSVKVAKGVYVRTGSMGVQPVKESYLEEIIRGELIVTNKRIIVDAGNDIKVIKLRDILKVTPYNDAIAIHKGTNSPALIFTNMNHAALTAFINRVIESEK